MSLPDAEAMLAALADRMRGAVALDACFVGIHSGGAWIADRLAPMIPGAHPVGYIDVSFYRDDFARKGLKPDVKRTELPFDVQGATIILRRSINTLAVVGVRFPTVPGWSRYCNR